MKVFVKYKPTQVNGQPFPANKILTNFPYEENIPKGKAFRRKLVNNKLHKLHELIIDEILAAFYVFNIRAISVIRCLGVSG